MNNKINPNELFPWYYRLFKIKQGYEHPSYIEEFNQWEIRNEIDKLNKSYISNSSVLLQKNWLKSWDSIQLVGPFVNRKRKYNSIPFIVVKSRGGIFQHIEALSERLVDLYLEFNIMPNYFIYSRKQIEILKTKYFNFWKKTDMISIFLRKAEY